MSRYVVRCGQWYGLTLLDRPMFSTFSHPRYYVYALSMRLVL